MKKIATFEGEKGFFKLVYAPGYYGAFTFKLKFKDSKDNCVIEDVYQVFCNTDDMEIEVWSKESNLSSYKFIVNTFKTDSL
jgi:hypothetical protein